MTMVLLETMLDVWCGSNFIYSCLLYYVFFYALKSGNSIRFGEKRVTDLLGMGGR